MVADKQTNDRADANQELIAQGIANVVSPLFGGLADQRDGSHQCQHQNGHVPYCRYRPCSNGAGRPPGGQSRGEHVPCQPSPRS